MKLDEHTYSLIIKSVRPNDFGDYVCRATNSLGDSEGLIELFGTAYPAVIKKESQAVSDVTFNFIWEVDSYTPIVDYMFWFRPVKPKVNA